MHVSNFPGPVLDPPFDPPLMEDCMLICYTTFCCQAHVSEDQG